jgi:hypothetical protein
MTKFGIIRYRRPRHQTPCRGVCTIPPLETGIQTVWPSPYHAGLAQQRLRCLRSVPRFPAMLWSPRAFASR